MKLQDLQLTPKEIQKAGMLKYPYNGNTHQQIANQATLKCLKELYGKLFWIFTSSESAKLQAEDCYSLTNELESLIKEATNER